nr:FCD domain-containing protein [Acetatifactor muris]
MADRIEQMILSDKSRVGQKLPSEQALATGFGVSRPVIREALAVLRARGLVAVQSGEGSHIVPPEPIHVVDAVNRMTRMRHISPGEVYEVRVWLEAKAAYLAAANATGEQLDELNAVNRRMEDSRNDVRRQAQLDLEFHQKLAEMSGNRLLSIFVQSMNGILQYMLESTLGLPRAREDGVAYHDRIIETLRTGDKDMSEAIVRDHLMMSMRNFEFTEENQKLAGGGEGTGGLLQDPEKRNEEEKIYE